MRTPTDVGKYRFLVAYSMLDGNLTMEQAVNIQKTPDNELARLIRSQPTDKGENK